MLKKCFMIAVLCAKVSLSLGKSKTNVAYSVNEPHQLNALTMVLYCNKQKELGIFSHSLWAVSFAYQVSRESNIVRKDS